MSDINCPYCKSSQEINHDDGYGYSEDDEHEQECVSCCKTFKFTTSISYDYEVLCNNGDDHNLEQSGYDESKALWECSNCDYYEVRR